MKINDFYEQIISGKHLSSQQMQQVIESCMLGELSDPQTAAFLALMRMKGETVEELTAAASVMRSHAHTLNLGEDIVDIVGTGGDGQHTFNISTISSFVTAAAGAKVAKHGNYSVSSNSGSADLLKIAGFELTLPDEAINQCINQCNIAFLFAPKFHQALKHARTARQALKIRTLFNLLGPLLNPAGAKKQVVGVYSKKWLQPIAEVLANIGSQHALVVHAHDGLDEISIASPTDIVEYHNEQLQAWTLDPKDYDCAHANLDSIIVDSPQQSLQLGLQVLGGKHGPARDIVLLNTAAALYCSDTCKDIAKGIQLAAEAIDSGKAEACFHQLQQLTQSFDHD